MNKGLKIFITYAHKNSEAKDELIISLAVLKQNGLIDIWHDNEILPGDKWRDEIFNNLADSNILLYLTCRYSLASENCNKELTAALNPNIRVIPIILEHCDWSHHQLSDFEVLPPKGKPISSWEDPSEGWQNVVDGIRAVINEMQVQAEPSFRSPRITPKEIETLASLAFQRGNFLLMLEQMDPAIAAYSRAIELNPNNAAAHNNRGIAYKEKGEHDCAIEDYNTAIELNPELAEAYNNRGNAHRERGEMDKAIRDCSKAIKLNPKLAEAYTGLCAAYGAKGEFDRAIDNCNTAIELNPKLAPAYSNRGNAYREKREMAKAIDDCNKAIELDSNYVEAYINRAIVYCQQRKFQQAFKDYNTAIELEPGCAEAYINRAVAYCQLGKFQQAFKDYSKAIHRNPNFVRAYYCRAFVCLHLREWDEARTDLTFAREKGADIIGAFHQIYGNPENFEEKTKIQLPKDIAAMLTPRQK